MNTAYKTRAFYAFYALAYAWDCVDRHDAQGLVWARQCRKYMDAALAPVGDPRLVPSEGYLTEEEEFAHEPIWVDVRIVRASDDFDGEFMREVRGHAIRDMGGQVWTEIHIETELGLGPVIRRALPTVQELRSAPSIRELRNARKFAK